MTVSLLSSSKNDIEKKNKFNSFIFIFSYIFFLFYYCHDWQFFISVFWKPEALGKNLSNTYFLFFFLSYFFVVVVGVIVIFFLDFKNQKQFIYNCKYKNYIYLKIIIYKHRIVLFYFLTGKHFYHLLSIYIKKKNDYKKYKSNLFNIFLSSCLFI